MSYLPKIEAGEETGPDPDRDTIKNLLSCRYGNATRKPFGCRVFSALGKEKGGDVTKVSVKNREFLFLFRSQ
jgi:hypothetical protein